MFSIQESLKYGWEKFKANLELVLLTTLFTLVLGFVGDKIHWVISVILIVVSIIVRIGYTKLFLRMSDDETPKFVDIFKEYRLFWKYLVTSILQGLAILGGLILLIIPGIIFAIKYSFAPLILIDTKIDPIGAMKESTVLTKDKKWSLLGFYSVLALVNIAGILALGVGLLVSIPVSMFAHIFVYRELTKSKAGVLQTASPQSA